MYDSDNPDRWIVGSLGRMILIGLVLLIVIGGCSYWWAPWKGEIEARNQTVGSGAYRNATYDEYFDTCAAIQSAEQKIKTYQAQLKTDPPPSSDQAARLNAATMVQQNQWITLVNQYNANADKEKTKGQFRDDGLPEHINNTNLDNGVSTTCA